MDANAPVPINLVTADDLIALRGIGRVYAERIVAYRDEHGPYRGPEDLAQVKGISPELAHQLAPDIDWHISAAGDYDTSPGQSPLLLNVS